MGVVLKIVTTEKLPSMQYSTADDVRMNDEVINIESDASSGSVLSAYSMQMPHAEDQPAPPNPIQQALNQFLQNHPLCQPITVPY
eukprot:scaffold3061_cov73-Cyclotella_meneghiniana.AAC.2